MIHLIIRKILYEAPAMILILDTRLLLKDDPKPPWEGIGGSITFALQNSFFSLHQLIKIFKWTAIILTLLALLTSLATNNNSNLLHSPSSIHESIAQEILDSNTTMARIQQNVIRQSLRSPVNKILSTKKHLHMNLIDFYRANISKIILTHHRPWEESKAALRALKTVLAVSGDHRKRLRELRMDLRSAIKSISGWNEYISSALRHISHCSRNTKEKMEEIYYIINFFQREEMLSYAQRTLVNGEDQRSSIQGVTEELIEKLKEVNRTFLSEEGLGIIVKESLLAYDADKTGKFDFALESAGGSVLSTRCSESLINYKALYTIFGFNVWYPSHNPRLSIQHGSHPGECWAFKGSKGSLVIQLSGLMFPKEISLEHIPKELSPWGQIDSAPKDFGVYGLSSEDDEEPMLLGEFKYSSEGPPLQSFPVIFPSVRAFNILELVVSSNHGHPNYTCLYRFRVHGNAF